MPFPPAPVPKNADECKRCFGIGADANYYPARKCEPCSGKGWIKRERCYSCDDTPAGLDFACNDCEGTGYMIPKTEIKTQPRRTSMNYTTAVMLINDEIRAISCSYEKESDPPADHQIKARTVFKTLDTTIKKGDYLVVPTDTRHKMTVVRVEETDFDVDFESDVPVQWAVGKVDMKTFNDNKSKEGEWVAKLKTVERKHQKQKLAEKVIGSLGVDDVNILKLTNTTDASVLDIQPKAPADGSSGGQS